jgi:hypothetical protein
MPLPKKNETVKATRAFRLVTLDAIEINGWVVQTSVLNNKTICLVLFNVATLQCLVRYFQDEMDAHLYFTDVIYGDSDAEDS